MTTRLFTATLAALLALTVGCTVLEPRPDPTRFFVLRSAGGLDLDTTVAPLPPSTSVGLGPITLPRYLDHLAIVRREGQTEMRVSDFDRWAEPLQAGVSRVLGDSLVSLTGLGTVTPFPWPLTTPIDYQVVVDVQRFEPNLGGPIELAGRWSVRTGTDTRVCASNEVEIRRTASSSTTDAQVVAMSEALVELAQEITDGLHTCRRERPAATSPPRTR
jgi:hypothetical protein